MRLKIALIFHFMISFCSFLYNCKRVALATLFAFYDFFCYAGCVGLSCFHRKVIIDESINDRHERSGTGSDNTGKPTVTMP